MKKRFISILTIFALLVTIVAIPEQAQAKAKNYIVLVQSSDGKWTGYMDLVNTSPKGSIMIKAFKTSKILGLFYQVSGKTYSINNGTKKLIYTKNSKKYTYYDDSSTITKTAKYKAYTATISKKSVNMAHYATLSNLVYTQYYTGDKATSYKVLGYDGIICYSLNGKIKDLPAINDVVNVDEITSKAEDSENDDGKDDTTDKDTVKYDVSVNIGGIEIPKLSDFSNAYNDPTGHWGADKTGDTPLEDAIAKYSEQMRNDIIAMNIEDNSGEDADIKINDNIISAQVNGDSTMSPLVLQKTSSGYQIYISTRLSKTPNGQTDYSKVLQQVLKLYCVIISSTPNDLYVSIYDSAETENTHGINTSSYVTIGDTKVKVTINNGNIVYSIKSK